MLAGIQAVPDLVQAMAGSSTRIYSYYSKFPQQVSLTKALASMPQPGIMVAYRGFAPQRRQGSNAECWVHSLSIFVRCDATADVADPADALKPLWLLLEGVPDGSTLPLKNYEFHPALEPMNVPSAQLSQLVIDTAGTVIEYWELSLKLVQKDDSSS